MKNPLIQQKGWLVLLAIAATIVSVLFVRIEMGCACGDDTVLKVGPFQWTVPRRSD